MQQLNVAREAWSLVGGILLAALVLYAGGWHWPAMVLVLAAVATGWLFRDPRPKARYAPLDVTSPCHGVCTGVSFEYDAWVERRSRRIDLTMGVFASYRVYAPIEAKIVDVRHRSDGRRWRRLDVWLRTDEGDDVVLWLAQHWPARLRLDYAPGERIGHGRPIGFAPLGARCTLLLPETVTEVVEPGAQVSAPVSALARLNRDSATSRGAAALA